MNFSFSLLGRSSDPTTLKQALPPSPLRYMPSFLPREGFSPSSIFDGHRTARELSRCKHVWLVHSSRRSNRDNINTSNTTSKHTSSDLIPGIGRIHRQQKEYCCSYLYAPLERVCSRFWTCMPPAYKVETPSRRGTLYTVITCTVKHIV